MKFKLLSYIFIAILITSKLTAQSLILTPGSSLYNSGGVRSTVTLPRFSSSQIDTMVGIKGSIVYDSVLNCIKKYDGRSWNCLREVNDRGFLNLDNCNSVFNQKFESTEESWIESDSSYSYLFFKETQISDINTLPTFAYVYKIDSSGNIVNEKGIIQTQSDPLFKCKDILLTDGHIYLLMEYCGTTTVCETDSYTSQAMDGLVVKLDKDLNYIWSKNISALASEKLDHLDFDSFENIYISGTTTSSSLQIDAEFISTPGIDQDVFILKIDSSGLAKELIALAGNGNEISNDIEFNRNSSKLYLLVNFNNQVTFEDTTVVSVGDSASYILELNPLLIQSDVYFINQNMTNDWIVGIGLRTYDSGNKMQIAFNKKGINYSFANLKESSKSFFVSCNIGNYFIPNYQLEIYGGYLGFFQSGLFSIDGLGDILVGHEPIRSNLSSRNFLGSIGYNSDLDFIKQEGGYSTALKDASRNDKFITPIYRGYGTSRFCNIFLSPEYFSDLFIEDIIHEYARLIIPVLTK